MSDRLQQLVKWIADRLGSNEPAVLSGLQNPDVRRLIASGLHALAFTRTFDEGDWDNLQVAIQEYNPDDPDGLLPLAVFVDSLRVHLEPLRPPARGSAVMSDRLQKLVEWIADRLASSEPAVISGLQNPKFRRLMASGLHVLAFTQMFDEGDWDNLQVAIQKYNPEDPDGLLPLAAFVDSLYVHLEPVRPEDEFEDWPPPGESAW